MHDHALPLVPKLRLGTPFSGEAPLRPIINGAGVPPVPKAGLS